MKTTFLKRPLCGLLILSLLLPSFTEAQSPGSYETMMEGLHSANVQFYTDSEEVTPATIKQMSNFGMKELYATIPARGILPPFGVHSRSLGLRPQGLVVAIEITSANFKTPYAVRRITIGNDAPEAVNQRLLATIQSLADEAVKSYSARNHDPLFSIRSKLQNLASILLPTSAHAQLRSDEIITGLLGAVIAATLISGLVFEARIARGSLPGDRKNFAILVGIGMFLVAKVVYPGVFTRKRSN